jgi:transglutaminase-like putative cysteine protease
MRIRVRHETHYVYGEPATHAIQTLRLTPRSHEGQFVCDWRIELDADCRLDRDEDPFGNITHTFTVDGPIERLTVAVEGVVETEDRAGFVHGAAERLPLGFWLRETELTAPTAAIRALAAELSAGEGADPVATLHALQRELPRRLVFDAASTTSTTSAGEAYAAGRGVCQDFAHIFVAAARALGLPARYVGGYLYKGPSELTQEAGHAWAEAHVPGLGWIGFDPANGLCVTDHYIRVAAGLDYLGAAPVRGQRRGGSDETLEVRVTVEPARRARPPSRLAERLVQSQSQG